MGAAIVRNDLDVAVLAELVDVLEAVAVFHPMYFSQIAHTLIFYGIFTVASIAHIHSLLVQLQVLHIL